MSELVEVMVRTEDLFPTTRDDGGPVYSLTDQAHMRRINGAWSPVDITAGVPPYAVYAVNRLRDLLNSTADMVPLEDAWEPDDRRLPIERVAFAHTRPHMRPGTKRTIVARTELPTRAFNFLLDCGHLVVRGPFDQSSLYYATTQRSAFCHQCEPTVPPAKKEKTA